MGPVDLSMDFFYLASPRLPRGQRASMQMAKHLEVDNPERRALDLTLAGEDPLSTNRQ